MHYKDGTEAKVGDLVRGKPYNTPREIVGEVVGLTPGADTCNLRVAFIETSRQKLKAEGFTVPHGIGPFIPVQEPGEEGGLVLLTPKIDYGETKAFELITRSR